MAELLHPHQKATQSHIFGPPGVGECAQRIAGPGGLVTYKTKVNESEKGNPPIGEVPYFDINFSKERTALNRVKRLKRSVWASGHLHGIPKKGQRPLQPWFVTLTYALADVWKPNHIKNAMNRFRRWADRRGYPTKYTWVSEIQPKRAARTGDNVVHYHLLIWLPVGAKMPHWDTSEVTPSGRYREPFWPHGITNTERAKAGVGYLMKYLSKLGELTIFPEGLRLYGIGGLDDAARAVRGWYNLPEWVKRTYGVGDVKRLGSALVDMVTGEVLEPMFSSFLIPGGIRLTRLRDYPERWHDGAYSTFQQGVNHGFVS